MDPMQPSRPGPLPPPLSIDTTTMRLQPVAVALERVVVVVSKSNDLALENSEAGVVNAKRMKDLLRGLTVAAVVFLLVSGISFWVAGCQASRQKELIAKLEETNHLMETLLESQDLTSRKVEGVGQQVQAVADEVPVLVLTDAGAGKPAKPSVVVRRPRTPQPTLVVPLELPKQEDAGTLP